MLWDTWIVNVSWMSLKIKVKGLGSEGYICRLDILHLGYNPFTNHVLTSWDILVPWILDWRIPGVTSAPSPHVGPLRDVLNEPTTRFNSCGTSGNTWTSAVSGYFPRKINKSPLKKWCLEEYCTFFLGWSLFRGELLNSRGVTKNTPGN